MIQIKKYLFFFLLLTAVGLQAQVAINKFYKITAKSSGKVMEVQGASTANGALIEQGTYSAAKSQHFKLATGNATGYFKINPVISGKCLDIINGSTADGANVQQYDCWSGDMQQYLIESTNDGYYKITVKSSGKCLGVDANSMSNGALIKQQTYTAVDNQKWQFTEVFPYGYVDGIIASQIGYKPNDQKIVLLMQANTTSTMGFTIINSSNAVVFSGNMSTYGVKWTKNFYKIDFSSFTTPGTYRIQSNGYTSYPFVINNSVWLNNTRLPEYFTSFFDYQRCTEAKEPADNNLNAYIRVGDNSASIFQNFSRDERFGWFSATSHDKHTTEQAQSMNMLMWAYLYNPNMFNGQQKNGMPAILDEVKWSMHYEMKMQDTDGGMFMAVHPGRSPWEGIAVPKERHLFVNKETGITARAMSSFALGYTLYKNIDPTFADSLLNAARKCFTWINKNPNVYLPDSICATYWKGRYDSRVLAAVEMYIALKDKYATEAQTYKTFVENAITNGSMNNAAWNSNGGGLDYGPFDQILYGDIIFALCRYQPYATGAIKTKLESSITSYYNYYSSRRNNPIGWIDDIVVSWFGGCGYDAMVSPKFIFSGLTMNNNSMYNLGENLAQVDYGLNPFQRTYVYGTGTNTFPDIFVRSAAGSVGAVAPGIKMYNGNPVDDYRISPPDYSTGEACIPYTPGIILSLALMDKGNLVIPGGTTTEIKDVERNDNITLYPNPAKTQLTLNSNGTIDRISITDITGRIMFADNTPFTSIKTIDINGFADGVYFIKCVMNNHEVIKKIIKN